ncbi:MAG: inositol monophosphatase family protein [Rhizobiales bacterium]|nr:inositol monophosphatase family protein [Hyphomicrobiales bacterium]
MVAGRKTLNLARKIDWAELSRFAKYLAEEAAKAILPHFRQDVAVEVKAGAVWDPVTEADKGAERIMRSLIEERFPDHGIVGEEYGAKKGQSGFTWILDPVDGTRAFICGMPTWATLIGLNFEGEPKLGLMSQPYVGDVFFGNPEGAWVDYRGTTRPLRVRQTRPLADAVLTTTAPELYRSELEKGALARLSGATRLTRYGGDAYFFCVLAAGQVDIAMDARMEPYDIAPLIPIIRGAGGVVSTWDRGNPAPGGNVISASSQRLLDDALAVIHA